MNVKYISNPEYFLGELAENYIIRVNSNNTISSIPKNNSNIDYQEYLKWIEEGNTPEPWNPEEQ